MNAQAPPERKGSERDPPTLHYRATAEPVSAPDEVRSAERVRWSGSGTLGERIVHGLTLAILGVVLAVWAIVGAVFWLPILVRTMFRFSLSLIQSTMDDERPEGSASMLRNAVGFYRRGFVVGIEAVLREDPLTEGKIRRERIDGGRMMKELAWAAVIWYVVLWWVGLVWSPGAVAAWVAALPWGETFGSIVDGFTGFLDRVIGPAGPEPAAAPTTSSGG